LNHSGINSLEAYQYNHKYGPGQYNYDVIGEDENGNEVTGNVDTHGKYITGSIEDEKGNTLDFDGEFVDSGIIEGHDEERNFLILEVD